MLSRKERQKQKMAGAAKKTRPGSKAKTVVATSKVADESVQNEAFFAPPTTLDLNPEEMLKLKKEREILQAAILEEKRSLARQSFWYFITNILFPDTWQDHYSVVFHKPICDEIQGLKKGQDLWLILGRESRKSFIANISRSLWRIVCDPNIRLLLVGAREATVKPFSRLIRSAFIAGTPGFETFQEVFSDFIYKEGEGGKFLTSTFEFDCRLRTRTTPDPTFRATYLGVTGAGFRADEITFDDPIERRHVTSPEMSMKTLGQLMDLFPLLDTNSKYRHIFGCGTRYKYHDPIGKIIGERAEEDDNVEETIERLKDRNTRIIVRHAFEDASTPCTHCPSHVVEMYPHGNPDMINGEPVIAPIHTRETLMIAYERYLMDPQLGEAQFWHQYMNVCKAPSNQKIQDEWFFQLQQPGWAVAKRRILAIDGAEKDFQRAGIGDYMVALFGEYDDNGRLCVVHGIRSNKMTRDEFQRQIISWCTATNWWPTYVVKEKFGTDTFLTDMNRQFLKANRPVFCHAETRGGQKDVVSVKKFDWIIASLQGPMERGELVWGSTCPAAIMERGKYELTNLGQSTHDDVADTLALFFVPKVRLVLADRGPNRGFKWSPPGMDNYGYINSDQEELEKMRKETTILGVKDSDIEKAKDRPRVQGAFAGMGDEENIVWDRAESDSDFPKFTLGGFEHV